MAKTFSLEFDGYWRAVNKGGLPAKSGIYCAYSGTYDAQGRTVSLEKLLYIGESKDVRDRVDGHEKWDEWEGELSGGQVLCFSAALITFSDGRERAEAAMIYKHKPPCNEEYVNSFPLLRTTVKTSGENALLHDNFTVS